MGRFDDWDEETVEVYGPDGERIPVEAVRERAERSRREDEARKRAAALIEKVEKQLEDARKQIEDETAE